MKTAVIFALVAISLCWAYEEPAESPPKVKDTASLCPSQVSPYRCINGEQNEFHNEKNCLQKTLVKLDDVKRTFLCVFCKYNNNQSHIKEDLYGLGKEALREFTECIGCTLTPELAELGFYGGAILGQVLHETAHTVEALGLAPTVAYVTCALLTPALTLRTECTDALKKQDPKTLGVSARLVCTTMLSKDATTSKANAAVEALGQAGCIPEELLRPEIKGAVTSAVSSLVPNLVDDILDVLKDILGLGGVCNKGNMPDEDEDTLTIG